MSIKMTRAFRLWDYNVSHNQLLFRSPKGTDSKENVDIVFWGVEYLDVPTTFKEVDIVPGTLRDAEKVSMLIGKPIGPGDVYRLVSSEHIFLVAAAGYKVLSNDLDLFESSLEYFRPDNSPLNRGRILDHS